MADEDNREGLGAEELGALADLASADDAEVVERALKIARDVLGMDLAYMTQFTPDDQVYAEVEGDGTSFAMEKGAAYPLEGSYCQRMVLGKIPKLVRDTARGGGAARPRADPQGRDRRLRRGADHPLRRHHLRDDLHGEHQCDAGAGPTRRPVHGGPGEDHRVAARTAPPRRGEPEPAGRVDALRVEVDQKARSEQVEEITGADWFKDLSDRAEGLRRTAGSGGGEGGEE